MRTISTTEDGVWSWVNLEQGEANVDVRDEGLRLWYEHPATQWVEALPIGNGRLGAMVFGGTLLLIICGLWLLSVLI